ncbi:MAG: hypothetical protein ACM3PY_00310 [Omnitrophica WOR_2 bacterium]
MPISPDIMRVLLVICLVAMESLAVLYLRQRKLSFKAYIGWGLLATLVPLIGPFLIIYCQPGESRLAARD